MLTISSRILIESLIGATEDHNGVKMNKSWLLLKRYNFKQKIDGNMKINIDFWFKIVPFSGYPQKCNFRWQFLYFYTFYKLIWVPFVHGRWLCTYIRVESRFNPINVYFVFHSRTCSDICLCFGCFVLFLRGNLATQSTMFIHLPQIPKIR